MADTPEDWGPPGFIPERTHGQLRDRVQAGTHFDIAGAGPAVVLVHGVGLDLAMWDDVAARLVRSFTVVRYDLLGHGRSAKMHGRLSIGSFVRQLENFTDYLRLDRFALAGFSLGAIVAQAYAIAHSGRLSRLCLLSSVHERSPEQQAAVRARLAAAETHGPHTVIDAAIDRWFTPAWHTGRPDVIAAVRRRLETNDRQSFLAAYRVFAEAETELAGRLDRIDCPALVVTGEQDSGSTPEMTRRLAAAIPGARAEILPGLAHMAPVEDAVAVARLMAEFLAGPTGQ